MNTYSLHPQILKALEYNLLTTPEECKKVSSYGAQALITHQYLHAMTKLSKGGAALSILEFVSKHLGLFDHAVWEDTTLKYFSIVDDGSTEGVSITLYTRKKYVKICRLSGVYGISGILTDSKEVYYDEV